jgi:hypothetical protein
MAGGEARGSDIPSLMPIALLSAAALAYEVLLVRLFAIIQWHHFAYMIISLALLGYGASGSLLAVSGGVPERRFGIAFVSACALFSVSSVGCFFLAQAIPFTPLELPWDPWEWARLAAVYLALALPFGFAGGAICLALARYPGLTHRIYSFDILGAGIGSLGVVALLYVVPPLHALKAIAVLGLTAGAWYWASGSLRPRWMMEALIAVGVAFVVLAPADAWRLRPSEYKELSQALRVQGARLLEERHGPLGWIAVVESPTVPFRHAPGLSLTSPAEPPQQLGVFTDGEGLSPITRYAPPEPPPAYLDYLGSALPYHLLARPRVLVLGAGGGTDVLQAYALGASSVDAVELNPQVVDLVRTRFGEYSGRIYSKARVHIAEARGFAAGAPRGFDLIQLTLLDSFGASAAGVHSLAEGYLYTVEAIQTLLRRLEPRGLLAITRWVTLPPRDALKLFATAVEALRASGEPQPQRRLVMVRSWKTATLLVKDGYFESDDIAAIKAFCSSRGFDLAWYPGMGADEANRFNILDRPYFFEGTSALLGPGAAEFIERYKFDIRPATDDRPYFFNFFRWAALPELLALREQGGLSLLDWGYPVLVATLAQAVVLSALLILLPLWVARRRGRGPLARPGERARVAAYFLAIGFAFMLVEIAFIQKFVLFLSHPIHSVAAVLGAFLVFAGLGSRLSRGLSERIGRVPPVTLAVALIATLALVYLVLLPHLFGRLGGLPRPGRIALAVALVAPLAFWMGMPFPIALSRLRDPQLVAWAWGVNGFASVVAAVLAALLAIHLGFNAVVLLALALYAIAAVTVPRRTLP